MKIVSIKRLNEPAQRWLNLWEVEYVDHEGKTRHWQFASRNELPDLTKTPVSNAVVVFATVRSPVGDLHVATKEARVVVGGWEWGVVAGLMNPGEDPAEAAARELFEETGLRIVSIEQVSPPLVSSAGALDEAAIQVYCTAEGELSSDHCEGGEYIETYLLNSNDVGRFVRREAPYHEGAVSAKAWNHFRWVAKLAGT
jgi:ADP-ribose pyrophosphatase